MIKSFLEERNEREMRMVYFLAQPNGLNLNYSLTEFMGGETKDAPQQTKAEIMDDVKSILSVFEGG